MAINHKYEIFASEYIKDFNASRAAIAAGYSQKTARRQGSVLMQKPAIIELIKEYQTERVGNNILSASRRMAILSHIAEFGKTSHEKIKAIEALNKMDGNITTNLNVESQQKITVTENPLEGLSVDELKKLIELSED